MNEHDIVQERCIQEAALIRHDAIFVTDRGMIAATDNDGWIKSAYCMTLFRKMKPTWNEDGTIRGVWCWI